ncbi:HTH domain-containing protein, partial [Oceanivirga salmonicida]|uniref:HTH domain-containing protein n=1 Tax=Oceanivirga salmonicida TaxID=1769291 RepID=UPI0012E3C305
MLNNREINILREMINKEKKSITEFSKHYNVSERTIRYNIKNINNALYLFKIRNLKIVNKLVIFEPTEFEKKELEIFINSQLKNNFSKEDRFGFCLFNILFNQKNFNISQISKFLNVSRMTIKNDLNELLEKKIIIKKKSEYILDKINNTNKKYEILNSVFWNNNFKEYISNIIGKERIKNIYKFSEEINKIITLNLDDHNYNNMIIYLIIIIYYSDNINRKKLNLINVKESEVIKEIYLKIFKDIKKFDIVIDFILGISLNYSIDNWINESLLIKKLILNISSEINKNLT